MNNTDSNLLKVETAMDAMRRTVVGVRERLSEGLQLTRTQFEILLMLAEKPHTTGELSQQLFLTQSAVTQTVDTLVRRNLAERYPDEQDRRIIRLQLGPAGRDITDNLRAMRRRHMQLFAAQLTAAEVESLISITGKLTTVLKETNTIPRKL